MKTKNQTGLKTFEPNIKLNHNINIAYLTANKGAPYSIANLRFLKTIHVELSLLTTRMKRAISNNFNNCSLIILDT